MTARQDQIEQIQVNTSSGGTGGLTPVDAGGVGVWSAASLCCIAAAPHPHPLFVATHLHPKTRPPTAAHPRPQVLMGPPINLSPRVHPRFLVHSFLNLFWTPRYSQWFPLRFMYCCNYGYEDKIGRHVRRALVMDDYGTSIHCPTTSVGTFNDPKAHWYF